MCGSVCTCVRVCVHVCVRACVCTLQYFVAVRVVACVDELRAHTWAYVCMCASHATVAVGVRCVCMAYVCVGCANWGVRGRCAS